MTALQKINQGTAPAGSDGDTVRSAFSKVNSNVDVLNTQAALTSSAVITAAQALTNAHVGKRVNINLTSAGTINMPAASTCAADQVTLLRNIGTTVVTLAIATGSGDTVALSKLNPGESALMDTDGVHAWSVLMRGHTNGDNEVVSGNCTVNGNETVGGTLGVTGLSTFTGGASFGASGQATISAAGAYSGVSAAYTGNVTVGGTLGVTGQATFSLRPTFAGKTPWDSGNLVNPATLDSNQTITGLNQFNQRIFINKTPVDSNWQNAPISVLAGANTNAGISLASSGAGSVVQLRASLSTSTLEVVNGTASSYQSITCYSVTQTSDERLKTDVETISSAMDKLRKIRGVYYTMDGIRSVGVIAQEVLVPFPELVNELGMMHEDGTPMLGVQYQNMIGPLIQGLLETDAALQSALSRIAALERRQ